MLPGGMLQDFQPMLCRLPILLPRGEPIPPRLIAEGGRKVWAEREATYVDRRRGDIANYHSKGLLLLLVSKRFPICYGILARIKP